MAVEPNLRYPELLASLRLTFRSREDWRRRPASSSLHVPVEVAEISASIAMGDWSSNGVSWRADTSAGHRRERASKYQFHTSE